jgi:DNA repair photolyase
VILLTRNLPVVLAGVVRWASWERVLVAVGTATDPYQPIEGHYRLTRRCLEILTESQTPFSIVTKGPMVVRDQDVLMAATMAAGCSVAMSVPSVDEQVWQTLEPGTASPAQRLRAIGTLAGAGIEAGVLMMPLLPGISTARRTIERTVAAIDASGARFIGAGVAHLEDGVREHFLGFLARAYPHLSEGYARLYERSYAPAAYVSAVKDQVRAARGT